MDTPGTSPDPSAAEQLFLEHLGRLEAGQASDLEELCRVHPEHAGELRELEEGRAWAHDQGLENRTRSGTWTAPLRNDPASRPDPWVGRLFHDKYRIVRRIGQGGFGTVYEAIDERGAGNPVAIKVLSGTAAESVVLQQSFRDEARRVTRLSHPNVVDWKVFDQTDEGLSYFVMELVRGEKFDAVLAREGRIAPDRAARLLLQVLDALRAAHHLSGSESILHLDLKPDNLFLVPGQGGREEQLKVIDFGIGQYIGDEEVQDALETLPGTDAGLGGRSTLTFRSGGSTTTPRSSRVRRSRGCTPEYASPEQVAHVLEHEDILPLDGRSDLYSLGVIAFQMLTGRLPFESRTNRLDVLRMHLESPVPRLASTGVRVPRRLARFVERCLEKDRERRWPDTQAAHEFLRRLVHPPVWRTVAAVVAPIVLLGSGLASWMIATREMPVPVAGLTTADGRDLDAHALALGPEQPTAVLHLSVPPGVAAGDRGPWSIVRVEDGLPLPGWSAAWEGDDLVRVGDLNGDGRPDLASIVSFSGTPTVLEIRFQDPDGNYPDTPNVTVQDAELFVASGMSLVDADGDGRTDVVVTCNGSDRVVVLFQSVQGLFSWEDQALLTDSLDRPSSSVVTDLDGDSQLDVVVCNNFAGDLSVFTQVPRAGRFRPTPSQSLEGPIRTRVVDLDGDGQLDLISTNVTTLQVYGQSGAGLFGGSPTQVVDLGEDASLFEIRMDDLDGDGLIDLVASEILSSELLVLHGLPGGRLPAAPDQRIGGPGMTSTARIALGDMNGDGRPDIVAANNHFSGPTLALFFQGENHRFSQQPDQILDQDTIMGVNAGSSALFAEDIDRDGRVDLVSFNPSFVLVIRQTGEGVYASQTLSLSGTPPQAGAIADLNGDGWLDLVASTTSGQRIFFQNGPGSFSPVPDRILAVDGNIIAAPSVTAADLDGNGLVDVIACYGTQLLGFGVAAYLQHAPGRFSSTPDRFLVEPGRFIPQQVEAVDLNSDGALDLFTSGGEMARIYLAE